MKRILERLANLCLADHQTTCPILEELMALKGFAAQAYGESGSRGGPSCPGAVFGR
jgi:MerR family copper efflux transcriptional regulator